MIKVNATNKSFNTAYWNARRALPVNNYESPREYGIRWRETYHCRFDPDSPGIIHGVIFDNEQDYIWFILRWT
jgi:hypothetical protein